MTATCLRSLRFFLCSLVFVCFALTRGHAETGLKTISNPGGGKITYGVVEGQTTEAGAMGAVLHSIHNQFGDRPQVGKLFSVHGTQSVACFFSVNKRTQGSGQLAGLLIVTKASTDRVEAAVVSDDASHFPSTVNPMLKTLFGAWHPLQSAQGAQGSAGPVASAAAASMKKFVLPDHSAWIDLPDGWQVAPQSGGGTIMAQGPNGESVAMGMTFLAMDMNNPYVRQTYATVQRGGLRGTSYATANYYPYGADPGKTFTDLVQMTRQKSGLPAADIHIAQEERFPSQPPMQCVHLSGQIDVKDGKGPKEMNTIYCATPPMRMGNWISSAYHTAVPVPLADKERATMSAILQSFGQDRNVINGQAAAIAAPSIAQTRAIGKAAADQAAAAHARNDIQNSSVYQRWDDMDRRSQEFSNYQLGYSVLNDVQNNAHGTFWNEDADAIVRSNPQRYEYVNAPDYWKGIDY